MTTALDTHGTVREPATTATLDELLRRIEGEYREMPGMCVTDSQAQRLWGVDATTCSFLLTTLIERRILRRTRRGTYVSR
jgi:hypothetical protein